MIIEQNQISFGQFFTPRHIADFMVNMITHAKNSKVLEPSCGEGIFIEALQNKNFHNITAYEIDASLIHHSFVINDSFLNCSMDENFNVIIGNPPYIRWKNLNLAAKQELANNWLWQKYFNNLCDYFYIFILKSINLLKDNGELIFICPDYWFSTTHAKNLRQFMMENGGFETIIRFHESQIFPKVNSSIAIFKYKKTKIKSQDIKVIQLTKRMKVDTVLLDNLERNPFVQCFNIPQFTKRDSWLFISEGIRQRLQLFENQCASTIHEICDIGNGMVSGLDKAFQMKEIESYTDNERKASIKVVKAKNLGQFLVKKITYYIFINKDIDEKNFSIDYPNFYHDLSIYREQLNKRYSYNKTIPFWQWSFLRNYQLFSKKEKRIFVPCKERVTHKNYFRFAMVDEFTYPTQDVTALFRKENVRESLEYILAYLNQPIVFEWLKYNGVIKGGIIEFSEKPLASIPFRKINWKCKKDIECHNKITYFVRLYQIEQQETYLQEIRNYFQKLGI
ncbi:HsdM family class I SAM-dependent methyltransferase [Avibacterium sp. 21-599]|uniref:HsdM family class I SAM-dependent methyltransferase n=1 Tax=Avibacterium sp. 21-599 TaxID=2911528 RepID=UPI002247AAA3|nr:N-6 DNA methylase [Avibacterium sp. 21-599]MCW9718842.1 SAM-dependent methyltransferase [Avibacterium sp. 21-599]